MLDPIIQELFPERTSDTFTQDINSKSAPLSNERFYAPPDYYRSVLDFDTGAYDLAIRYSYYIAYALPSGFAQENLLYLQLLASEMTSEQHYTRREGLFSYLCAQTFWGRGILTYEGKEYILEPGDVFLIDCVRPHEYRAASPDGWGYRIIHFNGTVMRGLYTQFQKSGTYVFHTGSNHALYQYTKGLFRSRSCDASDREIEEHSLLTSLVVELLKQLPAYKAANEPEQIVQIRRYLSEHCTEALTLDKISEHFHMSKYYLCRDFKRHTGETVFQYITKCRMDAATYLLVNSRQSVEQIALKCGFSEVNSFFYAFRKYTRMSPSAYRKQFSRNL